MGGVLDFLFEGKPPQSVTTYGSTTQNLPPWLSDYTQGLITRANTIAAEPYPTYGGPRVAGFTPEQTQAFSNVNSNVGNYKPYLDNAGALTASAGATDVVGAAEPYISQAGKSFPSEVSKYMNPYTDNVINRAELEANRNFNEKIMPQINNRFTANGQYGSSAHQREADRAARDLTEGLQSQSLGALSQAYGNAGQLFEADQGRQAQLGQLSGQLANTQGNLQLESGKQTAALGDFAQSAGIRDVGALEASGAEQQQQGQKNLDLAYGDFTKQRDDPRNQIDWLSSVIRGTPYQSSTNTTKTGPADEVGPTGLSQLATLGTAAKGIYDIYEGKARGGPIRRARGGVFNLSEGGKITSVQRILSLIARGHLSKEDGNRLLKEEMRRGNLTASGMLGAQDSMHWDDTPITNTTSVDAWTRNNEERTRKAHGGMTSGIRARHPGALQWATT